MGIIEVSEQIEEIVLKNDLTDTSLLLKDEYAISKSEELKKAIKEVETEGRILKIGIVGRVKAGKSSLLNALIFEGKDILPKAATPMTAALTVLEYGEETQAEVDFFSQADIDDIKRDYNTYIDKLETCKEDEFKKLLKIKSKKNDITDELKVEIKEKALKIANRNLRQNDKLFSSYDQYLKIKASGVTLDELKQFSTINAQTPIELNNKLLDFVGANGKFMPFTKSVTLKLKIESLKDIQIIDTPGVNDPVTSREDRTKELLKYSDVVLVVSPSGQFLSSEDLDLMDRITTKEGIKEIYLVASQVDNQLFGSEKEKGSGILNNVLKIIEDNLSNLQKDVLIKQKNQFPEIGTTFDELINNKVILSSGISYSMIKSFDKKEEWDENTKKVWENLNKHYKDFFDNTDNALANLEKLANIDSINNIIENVRSKKDEILQKRKEEFYLTKHKSLINYKDALITDVKENIKRVNDSDVEEVRAKKERMDKVKYNVISAVNEKYFDIVESFEIDFKESLLTNLNDYFKTSTEAIGNAESTDTETWTHDHGFFSLKFGSSRYEERSRTYSTVRAGAIKNSLELLTNAIEDKIDSTSKKRIKDWKKNIYKSIVPTLRVEGGDNVLDTPLIIKTIKSIINLNKVPEIYYSSEFPVELKKNGTLKEYEAEQYISAASEYISNLRIRVRGDIKIYLDNLMDILKDQDIGTKIFEKYSNEIEKLENEIKNKELTLAKYYYIIKQLENIDD